MTNNDVIRRLRFIFDFNDTKMMDIFALADHEVTRGHLSDWLKKDDDPAFLEISDYDLAVFLNGLIIEKRGKKEGAQPVPEEVLNNNIVFRKIKIALNLQETDILEMLALADMKISKHELSALFRNPKQSQYRACNDQLLRNFLMGMQLKYKG